VPQIATFIFLIFYNKPELGSGIDPGMALTPFPSSIVDETRFEHTNFQSWVEFANHYTVDRTDALIQNVLYIHKYQQLLNIFAAFYWKLVEMFNIASECKTAAVYFRIFLVHAPAQWSINSF